MTNDELFSQLLDKISSFDYIHADQIPNIDLYMDQVTTFMDTHILVLQGAMMRIRF